MSKKKKQAKESIKIPKQVSKLIPYESIVRDADIIEVDAGIFSSTFRIDDSNYVFDSDKKDEILADFSHLINAVDEKADFQFTFRPVDGVVEKYLTYAVHAEDVTEAQRMLKEILSKFNSICADNSLQIRLEQLSITEQLSLIYDIYHHDNPADMLDKLDGNKISADTMQRYKLTTKDVVGPNTLHFAGDYIKTDHGYIRILFINSFADHLQTGFFEDLLSAKEDVMTTVHYHPIDPAPLLDKINKEIADYKEAAKKKKKARSNPNEKPSMLKKLVDKKKESNNYPNEEEIKIKESYTALLQDAVDSGTKIFQLSFLFAVFAPTLDELNAKTEKLTIQDSRFFYKIVTLDYQQKNGLTSVLPLAKNKVPIARTFSSKAAALFFPFSLGDTQADMTEVNELVSKIEFYTIKTKINKAKTGEEFKVKKTIQETIPYLAAHEEDGIFESVPGVFSRVYKFSDINYHTATEEDQTNFLIKYSQLLNRFDSSIKCQIVLNNKNVDMKEFKQDNLLRLRNDDLDVYRKEYNAIVTSKMEEGRNNLKKERYLAISIEEENFDAAKHTFNRLDPEIINAFKEIGGSRAEPLTTVERLEVLYDIYNIGHEGAFLAEIKQENGGVIKSTDLENLYRMGVTSKDLIAPSGFEFKRDWFKMGDKYCRVMYLVDLPNSLSDKFVSELSSTNCNMVLSINLETIRQDKAVKLVKHQMLNINSNMQQAQQTASKNGYSMELVSEDLKQAQAEANDLLRNLTGRNQKMFHMTFTVLVFGDDYDEMQTNSEILISTGRKYLCNIKKLNYQQEDGLNATLPYCFNRLRIKRTLTTDSTIIFSPFDTQELLQKQGMYYGQNATSHNLILFNRSSNQNGNGWILGTPGCVDKDTEFFNGCEWKSIADYQEGELVLQFDTETYKTSLIEPNRYIKAPCDKMYHFETPDGFSQTLSPEHRVLFVDNKDDGYLPKVTEVSATEFATMQKNGKFNGLFITYKDDISLGYELLSIPKETVIQEIIPSDGYKYCFTVPTHALVLRRNGKIFVTGNSGKSFSAKREMANVFLNTDDDILIIDPEREYSPLVKAFGGSIVRIAPGSKYHLNPLDMDKDYGDDDDPIVLKSDFMLSLCESVIGGRYGLTPTQIAIIDRCVNIVYKDFTEKYDYDKKHTPTLLDFENILEKQPEREARELALAFEIYTKGSLDVFAHKSNVDIDNRFVVYDIKDIGSNIKTMAYLIVLDNVWNRVVSNRKKGKKTWIYLDEIYILLDREEAINYVRQIFSRGRKWGALTTGITQNVEVLLQSSVITTMVSNSAFIQLLNQAPVDRDILASLLRISPTQVSFICDAPPGQGVLYVQGQGIIPFRDNFSKQLAPELYAVMTSKPDEMMEEFR